MIKEIFYNEIYGSEFQTKTILLSACGEALIIKYSNVFNNMQIEQVENYFLLMYLSNTSSSFLKSQHLFTSLGFLSGVSVTKS